MDSILTGQPNFRDLGGISTKSGKTIIANKIFRSGILDKLDDDDLSTLQKLNVGKVLDLRTSQEIDLTENGNYPEFIRYENIEINAGNISKSLIPIFEKGEFHLLEPNLLEKIYFEVITKFKTELASVYRAIINADNGIVYHCSHGKDRTGIISALLLDFWEVDRSIIYEDYLRSNELLMKRNEFQLQMIKDNFSKRFQRDISDDEFTPVKSLFYCREEYLKAVFDYLDNKCFSVHNYFKTELGLTEVELELLKSKYLA